MTMFNRYVSRYQRVLVAHGLPLRSSEDRAQEPDAQETVRSSLEVGRGGRGGGFGT